jgi:hypothetical protein
MGNTMTFFNIDCYIVCHEKRFTLP